MEVQQKEDGTKGTFYIQDSGMEAAAMYYVYAGTDKFIIDHTEVSPAYEGKGLGKQLVRAAVDFARAKGLKIIPLCPYAKSVFEKVPEYADVLFG